ncbi:MAG: trimethylamine methyltransferase family protein [Chloroflexi bacterium]|nr:trimethylamine methyltransferase family protein [Chloroflexota bacterium]
MAQLKFLSDDEVKGMHNATLRILNEVGYVWTHKPSLEILTGAGCKIKGNRVYFPPELVEDSIKKAGKKVSIRGRGGVTKNLGDGNLYFHNLGGARDIYDAKTGGHRIAQMQDVRDATRLLDALENCHTITPFFTPQDVPGELMSLAMYRHALPFTTKPLQGPGVQFGPETKYAVRMAEVIGDPKEVLTLALSPVSPLTIPDHEAEAVIEIAKAGISFGALPCPTAGATSPMTISGSIAQQNAETLAVVILAQLVNPGLPIVYCGRLAMMEPRTGASVWGGVELALASAGTVQLGHSYGFAVNVYGFSTNAHTIDAQDGFERGLNAAIPALAGADELSGIGEMEAGVMGSYAQMVLDNELAYSVLRLRKGFSADEEALGVDMIARIMDGSRNFLGQKHTMKYLKAGEVQLTKFAERSSWEAWERNGKQGMVDHAIDAAEKILREHEVTPLEPQQEKELDDIMSAAEKELVKKR